MKSLIVIVHGNVQQQLADRLRSLDQVHGFTFVQVEGHATYVEGDPLQSPRDQVVGYVPRVRVDILLDDPDVATVLAALRETEGGLAEQGIYWVSAVEEHGRL